VRWFVLSFVETADLLLALNALPGVGPGRLARLGADDLAALGADPAAAWSRLGRGAPPPPRREALRALARAERERAAEVGARILVRGGPDWPEAVEALDHPPPVLHAWGDVGLLSSPRPRVAVVGARACTGYGRAQAERFGAGLAAGGAVVVSGGARGVDRHAMEAARDLGGPVVAVLGSALDRPYPPEAAPLFRALAAEGGLVVSEFPYGTRPRAGNFPRRNRVLAAVSDALLVVQATRRSGSMNSAGWAVTLGREVFALPGPVDCEASRGPHALLREGAALAEGPEELLAVLSGEPTAEERGEEPPLLAALAAGDRTLDELAAVLGAPPEAVRLELVEWELAGRVVRRAGGTYHRLGPR